MERNFRVEQEIVLRTSELAVDVFNAYVLEAVSHEPALSKLTCTFRRDHLLQNHADRERFAITFTDVTFVEMTVSGPNETDRGTVDGIGFKAPEDQDLDWLLDEGSKSPEDHIVLRLFNGGFVRVFSRKAELA